MRVTGILVGGGPGSPSSALAARWGLKSFSRGGMNIPRVWTSTLSQGHVGLKQDCLPQNRAPPLSQATSLSSQGGMCARLEGRTERPVRSLCPGGSLSAYLGSIQGPPLRAVSQSTDQLLVLLAILGLQMLHSSLCVITSVSVSLLLFL